MKKLAIILIALINLNCFAVEFDGLNIGTHGKYVWRGITFNNQTVQQGDTGFSVGGLSFNIWWNQDLAHENRAIDSEVSAGEVTEIDYTISYSKDFSGVGFDIGYIFFAFPQDESINTNELYIGFSYGNFAITIYKDFDLAKGSYTSLSYSKDFAFSKGSITLDIALGFTDGNNADFHHGLPDENGASDLTVSLSASFPLSDKISIEPYIAWATLFGQFATEGRQADDDNRAIWSGVNIAFSF